MPEKSTGWKLPLLFTAGIIGVSAIIYQFLPREESRPALPSRLEERARETTIDLDSPQNGVWKDAIVNAASGFAPVDAKDEKLRRVILDAINWNKLDVACAGSALLKTESAREEAFEAILEAALSSCESVHFGVCALGTGKGGEERTKRLKEKFYECERGLAAPGN